MVQQNVRFHLPNVGHGEIFQTTFDRSTLRLGRIVHVVLTTQDDVEDVMPEAGQGSVPHAVTWIAPSNWTVVLEPQLRPGRRTIDRAVDAVGARISNDTLLAGLSAAASDVRLQHSYKRKEFERSRLHTIEAVLQRIDLVGRLSLQIVSAEVFDHWASLVTYLHLTCFDLLGQPAESLTFDAWLSKQRGQDLSPLKKSSPIDVAEQLFAEYQSAYGVKNSFYRFLREVLPGDARQRLLSSVHITTLDLPPDLGNPRDATDEQKEKYLFGLRNGFTHRAKAAPGVDHESLPWPRDPDVRVHREQWIDGASWTSVSTVRWPEALQESVRDGLATFIAACAP